MPCIPNARDISILYPVGTATMDMHRTQEKKRQAYLTRNDPTKPLSESALECRSNFTSCHD